MEKLVYLILSRDKDRFNIVYVGECAKTDDKSFFVRHPGFKCWVDQSGSEESLFLAILPLFESSDDHRKSVLNKIIVRYKPHCNSSDIPTEKPVYAVRESDTNADKKFTCPCCGSEMEAERSLEKSTVYRCTGCGMSDTRLNS